MTADQQVQELNAIAALLPSPDEPPSPDDAAALAVVSRYHREAVECRRRYDDRMESIQRTERAVWILFVALLAGVVVAAVVDVRSKPAQHAEFLPEAP